MGVRKSIFDSREEKSLYHHLKSVWGDKLNIYPNLPFTKIFDIETLKVDSRTKSYLLKTNVDITVCMKDKPLMCIEFDGISGGFNRKGRYIQRKFDKERKRKLELKLQIAQRDHFPFFVISYEEEERIPKHTHLMLIDSIIGQTIATKFFKEKVKNFRDSHQLSKVNEETFQDIVMQLEAELELEWDPIAKKVTEIEAFLMRKGLIKSWNYRYLEKPSLSPLKNLSDTSTLVERAKMLERVIWIGCRVVYTTIKGKTGATAWVRNIENEYVSPFIIAKNSAMLTALYKVLRLFKLDFNLFK